MFEKTQIDSTWTLFLDRDGVINKRIPDDYVKKIDEFQFLKGVKDAISFFPTMFSRVFIVTNQQGIGKGWMTEQDLQKVHTFMLEEIKNNGGHIDRVFHCPALKSENSNYRKPRPGMALQAKEEFPEIDLKKSIMVGDSLSDMEFAKNAGMFSVFIKSDSDYSKQALAMSDLHFDRLIEFAEYLK
ncbi:MAG: D-glycero-alpha-D-manno-heptose-1,7-bisphosphate 7-phosphatase [Bacteroidales bacterium]